MNKREWRMCYEDLRNEIDQVRRECAEQLERAQHSRDYYKTLCEEKQVAGRKVADERDALLTKVEELRRDAVRLATELARVQGVCDATVVQVQKHAATIIDLRERVNDALKESEVLLAWQRGVREALLMIGKDVIMDEGAATLMQRDWDALRRAIESDETKEET